MVCSQLDSLQRPPIVHMHLFVLQGVIAIISSLLLLHFGLVCLLHSSYILPTLAIVLELPLEASSRLHLKMVVSKLVFILILVHITVVKNYSL